MSLSIIVAMTEKNRVIGINNRLPWHLSEDLKRFKRLTVGHTVIMGRKTFESIGKPLPDRKNVVITRNTGFQKEGIQVMRDADQAFKWARNESDECFVIGGAEIFKLALPQADKFYLTLIHKEFDGDVTFPPYNLENFEVSRSEHQAPPPDSFSYSYIDAVKTLGKVR